MTKILIHGKIEHKQLKEYQGETTTILQFISKNDKKGFEVIKVKLIEESMQFKEGDIVSIPVSISTMNNSLFYTQSGKIETLKG